VRGRREGCESVLSTDGGPDGSSESDAVCEQQCGGGPVPAVPAGPKTEFGNGTWEIGVDIAPGKYKTSGPEDSGRPCFAQTTKEGDASLGDIQKQELSEGPLTFIIPAKGVKFFESAGCSVWKKAE
jgi:hypothetical protein